MRPLLGSNGHKIMASLVFNKGLANRVKERQKRSAKLQDHRCNEREAITRIPDVLAESASRCEKQKELGMFPILRGAKWIKRGLK